MKTKEKTVTIFMVILAHLLVALFLVYMKEVFDFMRPNAMLIFWSIIAIGLTFAWYKFFKEL